MKGERYKNSLTSCDLYDNPYNPKLQVRPELIRKRQALYAQKSASTVVKQDVLEKQLLIAFQKRNFEFFPPSLLFFSRIFRTSFLAVMIPVHFCLYRLPQWVLSQGIPYCSKYISSQISQVKTFVRILISSFFLRVKKEGEKLIQPPLSLLFFGLDKGKQGYRQGKEYLHRIQEAIFSPLRRFIDFFQPLVLFYKRIRSCIDDFKKKIRSLKEKAREALIDFPQVVLKKLKHASHRLKQKLIVVREAKDSFFAPMRDFMRIRKTGLHQKIKEVKNLIERYVAPITKMIVRLKQLYFFLKQRAVIFSHYFYPVILFTRKVQEIFLKQIQWIRERKEILKKRFEDGRKIFLETFKQTAYVFISACYHGIKKGTLKVFYSLPVSLRRVIFYVFNGICLVISFFQKISRKEIFQRHVTKKRKFLGFMSHIRLNKVKIAVNRLEEIFQKMVKRAIRGWLMIEKGCKKGVYIIRLCVAGAKVLLKHGMVVVREKTRLGI